MTDFYPKTMQGLGVSYPYNNTSVNSIDLRAELHNILFGNRSFIPQGHKIVLRHMERMCPCVLEERGQKHRDADPKCSLCHGEGFLYSDHVYTAWRSLIDAESGALPATFQEHVAGLTRLNSTNFWMEWTTTIAEIDMIFEINLTDAGIPPYPLKPTDYIEKYKIDQLISYRGDNGRIEYKRAVCTKEQW